MKLIIHSQPITKKNSQQIIMAGKRPCIIQSKAYRQYERLAREQIALLALSKPVCGPIEVTCLYWLATSRIPDLCNLLAASHDVLEHCGVIENDSQIISVDGSRIMGKDAANPRVEITITQMEAK
jgi:Holliday junction resolvase RusA-like endonuclease